MGVIELTAAFKREVIAEGVETIAHCTALLHLGYELAQGCGIPGLCQQTGSPYGPRLGSLIPPSVNLKCYHLPAQPETLCNL